MNFKKAILGVILSIAITLPLLTVNAQTESTNWLSAEAEIQEIEQQRSGRKTKQFATILFNTEAGDEITTKVELLNIPVIGHLESEGDTITVHYDENNPALAQTTSGKFITQYGMYFLILLGIIFSAKSIIQAKKQTK